MSLLNPVAEILLGETRHDKERGEIYKKICISNVSWCVDGLQEAVKEACKTIFADIKLINEETGTNWALGGYSAIATSMNTAICEYTLISVDETVYVAHNNLGIPIKIMTSEQVSEDHAKGITYGNPHQMGIIPATYRQIYDYDGNLTGHIIEYSPKTTSV